MEAALGDEAGPKGPWLLSPRFHGELGVCEIHGKKAVVGFDSGVEEKRPPASYPEFKA